MRKIYFFLLLATTICGAQIVTIPDNLFKGRLLDAAPENQIAYGNGGYMKIDTNGDGEIQVAEAQAVDSLNVPWSQISMITGIAAFSNLKKLDCSRNMIQNFDVSALVALQILDCNNNQLASIDVTMLPNLRQFNCDYNNIGSLNLTGMNLLESISCSSNQLSSLSLTDLPQLQFAGCFGNEPLTSIAIANVPNLEILWTFANHQLTTLDATGAPNLKYLDCEYSGLTALNVSGLTHLENLYADSNSLTALNVSGLNALKDLRCAYNQLTSLDLTGLNQLETLICYLNQIQSLDVSGLTSIQSLQVSNNLLTTIDVNNLLQLTEFNCSGNQLTTLTVSGLPNLRTMECTLNHLTTLNLTSLNHLNYLACSDNNLTNLDVSNLLALDNLYCSNNQLTTLDCSANNHLTWLNFMTNPLQTVYLKNGSMQQYPTSIEGGTGPIDIANTPLQFICGDDFELAYWNSIFQGSLTTTSYCPFTGGASNSITGTVHFDSNADGCDSGDPVFNNIRIDIADALTSGAAFTNTNGSYNFYVQQPDVTLTPVLENPNYFTVSPTGAALHFPSNNNSVQTQNFCVGANGSYKDAEVVAVASAARPGFDTNYRLVFKNKGNQTLSGTVTFDFDDALMDLVSANPSVSVQNVGILSWNYANLLPFETRTIDIVLNVNGPMEIPPAHAGDILHFTATINPISEDEIPADNTFSLNQLLVNSLDPNNKICLDGDVVSAERIGDYLHYAINFENTGTAPAQKIVVKDVIDTSKFDLSSLQVLNASHTVNAKITGNKVEFVFENINLIPNAHGNVVFKIKTKSNLAVGNSVSNKADIYFDYNFPIETNTATSVFQVLSTNDFKTDNAVAIAPNPASNFITISANDKIESVELYDVNGRVVATYLIDDSQTKLDVSQMANGMYFVKVVTEKGTKIQKIIRK